MHDIKWIRENREAFDRGCLQRGLTPMADVICAKDDLLKSVLQKNQERRERRKIVSQAIADALHQQELETVHSLKTEVAQLKESLAAYETEEARMREELDTYLLDIPNLPYNDVPEGKSEADNIEKRRWMAPPRPSPPPFYKEHDLLGEEMGWIDFASATRMSGARFVVTMGPIARLERALMQFMLDMHVKQHGYLEVNPPLLVRDAAMYGTAQLPKFRDDQFQVSPDLWLIPTAEVPLTNLVRESILEEHVLPLRFVAATPCFRAEAGAHGKDTRGMIRQHQFYKVELVSITDETQAETEHERMTDCAENILKALGLSYRVMLLCSQDMGFSSRRTYDLEVWLEGQKRFREISSCSLCGTFQARRMNSRYRARQDRKLHYTHTLNGSGIAIGRTLVAILENYQNADGSINIPEALQPYMEGLKCVLPRQDSLELS